MNFSRFRADSYRLPVGLALAAGIGLCWPAGVAMLYPGARIDPAAYGVMAAGGLVWLGLLWLAPRTAVCLLAAWLPLSRLIVDPGLPLIARMLPLALCFALAARALLSGWRPRGWPDWGFLAVAGWFLLTALISVRPFHSVLSALDWILPFAAFFIYLRSPLLTDQMARDRQLRDLFLAASVLSLVLVAYAFLWSPFPGKAAIRPFFLDANFFSAYLSLLLPGLVWVFRKEKKWVTGRRLALVAAVLIVVALIALRSRGAWIGLVGGMFVALLAWLDDWRQRGLVLAGGLALALVFSGIMRQYFQERPALPGEVRYLLSAGDLQTDFSNRERLMRWTCAWRMGLGSPVAGHGPGNFAPDFKHFLRSNAEVQRISYWFGWTGGAHSVWMTALAETGWPGLLLFLGWLGGSMTLMLWKGRSATGRGWVLVALAAWGTWITHGVFNDLLMEPALAAMTGIWMAAGLPGDRSAGGGE